MRGLVLLLAILLAGCGSKSGLLGVGTSDGDGDVDGATPDSGLKETGFPLGTYTRCARGTFSPDGTTFLLGVGWEDGAELTLSRTGNNLHASYLDVAGETQSLELEIDNPHAATLVDPGQIVSGYTGLCPIGIGVSNAIPFPGELRVDHGALGYDAGTVFVALDGRLEGDIEECGHQSIQADMWLVCDAGPLGAQGSPAESEASELPAGEYACTSQILTYYESNGLKQNVGSGGSGTLALGTTGTSVTADIGGGVSLAGKLDSNATTAKTALAEHDQILETPCEVPITPTGQLPPEIPEPLPVHAAHVTQAGAMLFVSFAGTMGANSTCPGARKAGSLICNTLE